MSIKHLINAYTPETKDAVFGVYDKDILVDEQIKVIFVQPDSLDLSKTKAFELLKVLDGSIKVKTIELDDLDETGKKKKTIDFDLDLAVSQSKDNAVYYIQYAHARICRMLEKAATTNIQFDTENARQFAAKLELDAETEILAKLAAYPEVLIRAANNYEPHQVGNYLKELAALFHGWYNENKVLGDDAELTQARLLLSANIKQVLHNGLELLGVSAPESM